MSKLRADMPDFLTAPLIKKSVALPGTTAAILRNLNQQSRHFCACGTFDGRPHPWMPAGRKNRLLRFDSVASAGCRGRTTSGTRPIGKSSNSRASRIFLAAISHQQTDGLDFLVFPD